MENRGKISNRCARGFVFGRALTRSWRGRAASPVAGGLVVENNDHVLADKYA
jgi:hypothetical protein